MTTKQRKNKTTQLPATTVTIRPGALFAQGSAIPFWYCSTEKVLECDIITRVDANTYKLYVKNSTETFEVDADQILWIEYEPLTSDAGVMHDQPALPINPIGDDVVRVEWRGVTASPNYKFFHKDGSTHRVWDTFQTQDLLEEIDFWLNEASWHFDGWDKNTMIWTRVQSDEPRTLNTADLRTQHEYTEWVGDEPAAPATKFQHGQAVNTRFWGKYVGRVVSISLVEDGITYYEVQLKNGRIVIEPEIYLSPAPQYEATLPKCKPRRALTMREIEARLDTPDHGNDDRARNYCWYGGVDLFAE